MSNTNYTRYPYTHACDLIRSLGGYNEGGCKLSRADAGQIRQEIAKAIGMEDEKLACMLADYYMAHELEISDKSVQQFFAARGKS